MNQAIKESCEKPQDAEKGRIEVRPAVSFVSDATYNDSVKDKAKFIEVASDTKDTAGLTSILPFSASWAFSHYSLVA